MNDQLADALASMTADWTTKMSKLMEDLRQMRKTYPEIAQGMDVTVTVAVGGQTLIEVEACSKEHAKTVIAKLEELTK